MREEVYSDICSIQIVNEFTVDVFHANAVMQFMMFLGFEIYENNMAEHMMLTFLEKKKIYFLDLPVV